MNDYLNITYKAHKTDSVNFMHIDPHSHILKGFYFSLWINFLNLLKQGLLHNREYIMMKFDINILRSTMKILYGFLGTPIKFNENEWT